MFKTDVPGSSQDFIPIRSSVSINLQTTMIVLSFLYISSITIPVIIVSVERRNSVRGVRRTTEDLPGFLHVGRQVCLDSSRSVYSATSSGENAYTFADLIPNLLRVSKKPNALMIRV